MEMKHRKKKYLPKLASGETIAAFTLTEPSSGSDANSIKSRAVLSSDGKHWVLNGSKIWISNGGIADIFTVFAQTKVKDSKTGELKDKVTAFIVERNFGGIRHGPPEVKMGIKGSNTAEVFFDDVKVPVENVIAEVGGGFKVAMRILNNGRFGMGAALSGAMKQCIKQATDHANSRVQFGNKISSYGLIKEKIAQMNLKLYATESMAYILSANMDRGSNDYQIEAAISKVFASEAAWYVCDEAIQILGGMGFMKECGLERVLRDLRIFRIFEGTNDILKLFISLTGIQTASEQLKRLQKALNNPLPNFGMLFEFGAKTEKQKMGMDITSDRLHNAHPKLKNATTLIEKQTANFGSAIEQLLIKHGKQVTEQQIPLRRIAHCAMNLYGMAAVTSRATRAALKGLASADHEILLANTFCEEASDQITIDLKNVLSESTDKKLHAIADDVFKNEGYFPTHPLGM